MPYIEATALVKAYRFHRLATGHGPKARNAPYALARAREDVAAGEVRYPFTAESGRPWGGVSWQPAEPASRFVAGPQRPTMAHIEHPETHGFRLVGEVQSEPRSGDYFNTRGGHGGWFTDPHGDYSDKSGWGLCWGVVYQLPGRKGVSRFVAGYEFGDTCGGPTLDLSRVYSETRDGDWGYCAPTDLDAAREAARAANGMAEAAADKERAYQCASNAGFRWAEKGEEIRELGKTLNAMVRECKAARGMADKFPAMAAAIAARYADLLDTIREARAERANLAEGEVSPLHFYPGDKEAIDAFNGSAGSIVLK